MNALTEAWARRSPPERRALSIGGAIVAVALFWALAWLPLERTRGRLEVEVPRLRVQVAGLQRDADEVQRLRILPGASDAAAAGSAAAALAAPAGARLVPADDRHLRLSSDDIAVTALLDWLAAAQGRGLHVERARLQALTMAGRVRADIVLARG